MFDVPSGRIHLRASVQMPHMLRTGIADATGMPESDLRVIAADVGGGPAVDKDGTIFVITGNGDFNPAKGDFSESIVRLALPKDGSGRLTVLSWWTPLTDEGRIGGAAPAYIDSEEEV